MGAWGDCPRPFATRLWKKAQRAWGWEGRASRAWKRVWACGALQASCPLRGFPKSFLPPWSRVLRVCVFPCASVRVLGVGLGVPKSLSSQLQGGREVSPGHIAEPGPVMSCWSCDVPFQREHLVNLLTPVI